jgi:hypothetical protein
MKKCALFYFFFTTDVYFFTKMYHICVNFFYGSFSNLNFYFSVFFELYSDKFISSRGFFKNKLSILALFLFLNKRTTKTKYLQVTDRHLLFVVFYNTSNFVLVRTTIRSYDEKSMYFSKHTQNINN